MLISEESLNAHMHCRLVKMQLSNEVRQASIIDERSHGRSVMKAAIDYTM